MTSKEKFKKWFDSKKANGEYKDLNLDTLFSNVSDEHIYQALIQAFNVQ